MIKRSIIGRIGSSHWGSINFSIIRCYGRDRGQKRGDVYLFPGLGSVMFEQCLAMLLQTDTQISTSDISLYCRFSQIVSLADLQGHHRGTQNSNQKNDTFLYTQSAGWVLKILSRKRKQCFSCVKSCCFYRGYQWDVKIGWSCCAIICAERFRKSSPRSFYRLPQAK